MNAYVIHFYNLSIYHSEKKEKEIKNYSTKVDEILLAGLRARWMFCFEMTFLSVLSWRLPAGLTFVNSKLLPGFLYLWKSKFIFIEEWLIYKVVSVSGKQQNNPIFFFNLGNQYTSLFSTHRTPQHTLWQQ